jgi:hypothetical protein
VDRDEMPLEAISAILKLNERAYLQLVALNVPRFMVYGMRHCRCKAKIGDNTELIESIESILAKIPITSCGDRI